MALLSHRPELEAAVTTALPELKLRPPAETPLRAAA